MRKDAKSVMVTLSTVDFTTRDRSPSCRCRECKRMVVPLPRHIKIQSDSADRASQMPVHVKDAASWAQALIMSAPFVAYFTAYYIRLFSYMQFGISADLITVRLEDILWVFAALIFPFLLNIVDWATDALAFGSLARGVGRFLIYASSFVLATQAAIVISIAFKCRVLDWYQLFLLVAQLVSLLAILRLSKNCRERHGHGGTRRIASIVSLVALFVYGAYVQAAYISFHNGKYQVCGEDRALIVGFDSQGRAIEKQMVDASDSGVCELGDGYRLVDVTGKSLHVERYSYIRVGT